MIIETPHGTKINYGVSRNMEAEDEQGFPLKVALVLIEHENGYKQRLAIPESKITYCGEELIQQEVIEAAAKGGIQVGSADSKRL